MPHSLRPQRSNPDPSPTCRGTDTPTGWPTASRSRSAQGGGRQHSINHPSLVLVSDVEKAKQSESGSTGGSPASLPSPQPLDFPGVAIGDGEAPESENARIERLGRQRPEKFKSIWAEFMFCYSILASMFMAVSSQHLPIYHED